jgi:hypothetical protein
MVDGIIPATPGSGINIESALITRPDGIAVHRERTEVPDLVRVNELLAELLAETRMTNALLARMIDMGQDELLDLRNDNLA